jgi:uncharacterized membrane protein YebE (DUF533 family)
MAQENFDQDVVSTSKFHMLRCLVCMAHADGIVVEEEIAYISALMNRLPLTEEQRDTLESDLDQEQRLEDLLRYINEPKYRGQVVYFARLMAYKDGLLHPSEQEMLDKMHTYAVDGLDMEHIRKSVQKVAAAELFVHDIEIDENRPKKGKHFIPWLQWLDEWMLDLGIDLLRD